MAITPAEPSRLCRVAFILDDGRAPFVTRDSAFSSSDALISSMIRNVNSKDRLQVRRVIDVPLREVSGICLRRNRNGRMSLIAVGDHAAKVAWFSCRAAMKAESARSGAKANPVS
jgi:hypothetical protein